MVRRATRDAAVLAVHVAKSRKVGLRHGLHAHRRVQQGKVVVHVFHGSHTQGTSVGVAPSILGKARQVHYVPTLQTSERFGRLEQTFVTNRAAPLQFLGDAVMIVVGKRDAGVTAHAVSKINSQSQPESARVTVGTVEDGTRPVVVKMTDATKVLGERLAPGFAVRIDAAVFRRLQRVALHAHDFGDRVAIERLVRVFHGHFPLLFAAETTGVETTRLWVSQFARASVVWTTQNGSRCSVVVGGSKFGRRKERQRLLIVLAHHCRRH